MHGSRARLLEDVVRHIKQEFLEMPGLSITELQARRLWALEPAMCSQILTGLVQDGFLLRSPSGKFIRVDLSAANRVVPADLRSTSRRAIA